MALLYRSLPVSSHSQLPRQPYPPRRTPSRTLAVRAVAREQGENWALGRGCGLLATATAMTIALPLILVPLPAQAIQPVRGVPTVQPAFPQHRGAQHALLSLDGRPACSVLCCLQHRRQECSGSGQLGLKPYPVGVPTCPLHDPTTTHSAPLLTRPHAIGLLQTIAEIEESAARCTTGACKDVRLAHSCAPPFAVAVVGGVQNINIGALTTAVPGVMPRAPQCKRF